MARQSTRPLPPPTLPSFTKATRLTRKSEIISVASSEASRTTRLITSSFTASISGLLARAGERERAWAGGGAVARAKISTSLGFVAVLMASVEMSHMYVRELETYCERGTGGHGQDSSRCGGQAPTPRRHLLFSSRQESQSPTRPVTSARVSASPSPSKRRRKYSLAAFLSASATGARAPRLRPYACGGGADNRSCSKLG